MRRLLAWFGPICGLALLLFVYRPVLFEGGQFGFRDAAHYYYPLYHKVQAEWEAGRWPLWDPGENAGMPLLGNPTAAVLYPGKLVFAAMSYPWAVRFYAIGHTALAFAGMLALLRSWGASRSAAAISAIGYAFGSPILFQYCNIIFLVGAAWTPWGLLAADRWLRLGRPLALAGLAAVLAMQVLGGDPESAYVIGLCAGGYALGLAWAEGRAGRPAKPRRGRTWIRGTVVVAGRAAWGGVTLVLAAKLPGFRPEKGEGPWGPFGRWLASGVMPRFRPSAFEGPVPGFFWVPKVPMVAAGFWALGGLYLLRRWRRGGSAADPLVPRLAGLAGAAVLAGMLAAAQLVPVLEYARISGRATDEGPHDIYPFSLEPYRLAELAWPGVYGRAFGTSVDWGGTLLPGLNHRPWVSSLYLGGLTLVLALGAFGFRGGPPWRGWMAGIAAFSLVGALGEYGSPIMAARQVGAMVPIIGPHDPLQSNAVRLDGWLRDGDGSPYCLMAALLPGFGSFRFPSKLLSFTTLALAALAGLGWDRAVEGRGRRAARIALVGAGLTLALLAAAFLNRGRLLAAFGRLDIPSIFGPLDPRTATFDLLAGLGQGGAVLAASAGLIALAGRRPGLAGPLAVACLAVDLGLANASIVGAVPQGDFEATPKVLALIAEAEKLDPSPGPYRVHRQPDWGPYGWRLKGSADRIGDLVRWESATLQPKYGLLHGVDYTMTIGAAEMYDYEWFFAPFPRAAPPEAASNLGVKPGESIVVYPRRGFDLWNSRYFILPGRPEWKDAQRGIASFLHDVTPICPIAADFAGPGGAEKARAFFMDEDFQVVRNLDAYPRAWVVHGARFKPPIAGLTRETRQDFMEEILYGDDPFWHDARRIRLDPKQVAWIESDDPSAFAGYLPDSPPLAGETVRYRAIEPQRVELEVTMARPGLVILADVYYPGWTLTIDGADAPIFRANRVMRGAAVKAGTHRLVYTYRPRSFRVGLVASAFGLVGLVGLVGWSARRGRRGG